MNYPEDYINKIIQGDCLEVMKQMPDKCVDLVLTDPPYGMDFQSGHRKVKYDKIENDQNLEWLPEFVKEIKRLCKENIHAYFFCSFHNVDLFKQAIQDDFTVKNILVWVKNNTGMGDLSGDYAPQYEFCIFATSGGGRKLNKGRDSNVMNFQRTQNQLHPTEKPVELMKFLISKSSNKGELVFDPFGGSCTTAVAAKQLGRKYICIEKEEKYVNICHERLKQELLFT